MKNILILSILFASNIVCAQGKYGGGNGTGNGSAVISNQALPVELVHFKGKAMDNHILLDWTTSSEINNEGFTIEKSRDAKSYIPIGFVSGHETSLTSETYTFEDIEPYNGINYYRLEQRDFSGKITHSDVIAVNYLSDTDSFEISPNPFFDLIEIRAKENVFIESVRIYNTLGKIVYTSDHVSQYTDLSEFESGLYYIVINDTLVKKAMKY